MNQISVSVAMATYNGEKYLVEQLESIFSQSLVPAEIVVCDDHSTDGTPVILEVYASRKLISYYKNDQRLGVINNFKKAASLTNPSNLIAFADQDDVWAKDKLEKLVALMLNKIDLSKPAMVFSNAAIIDRRGASLQISLWDAFGIDPDRQSFKTLLLRNIVPGCTMLINNQMQREFMAMPEDAYMHDAWITFISFALKNYAFTSEQLVQYRQHENNVTYSTDVVVQKSSLFEKVLAYWKGTVFNTPLLEKEFVMARLFFAKYKHLLSPNDTACFFRFLNLQKRNFFIKKMYIRQINTLEMP